MRKLFYLFSILTLASCGAKNEGNENIAIGTSFNDARVFNAGFMSCFGAFSALTDNDVSAPALQVPPITIKWDGYNGASGNETGALRIFQIELILSGTNLDSEKVSFSITGPQLAATLNNSGTIPEIAKGTTLQSLCNAKGPFYVGPIAVKDKSKIARGTLKIAVDALVRKNDGRDEVVSAVRTITWEYNPSR